MSKPKTHIEMKYCNEKTHEAIVAGDLILVNERSKDAVYIYKALFPIKFSQN